jgi:2-polyprenyl-3-methyl-5-hydroxy-6-metoxy-1,4-benzoquinol methylase
MQNLKSGQPAAAFVPHPFQDDVFELFRHGVFDDENIDVLINQQQDFAYLSPQPEIDYSQYVPRVKKLGLSQYKAKLDVYFRRFLKVATYLEKGDSILDVGTGDGLFLKIVKEHLPQVQVVACEKDQSTLEERRKIIGDETFEDIDEIVGIERTFSVVSLFHVLEHILDPATFLKTIRKLLTPESVLIIEIPSLTCPLLTLYKSEAYHSFYFQKQHPFNYSFTSLQRLMEYLGFQTLELISFQRYGLENHLNWLTQEKPGGSSVFKEIFECSNAQYIADLEQAGKTDSAIWVGKCHRSVRTKF